MSGATGTVLVVVISGPSGVGKDALIERIAGEGAGYHFTVTATTRPPRPSERDGVNHFFVSEAEFEAMIARGELLEWARVYGNYYGVPRQQVRDALAEGRNVMIRVDVQGAARLRSIMPEALFIFVLPPSLEVLRRHLEKRGVNSEGEMGARLAAAQEEIRQAEGFDYRVVNHEGALDDAVDGVREIIQREMRRDPPRSVEV